MGKLHPRSRMFGRRQRREQEEDHPLVPHGLVWQAMDETPDAEVEASTPPVVLKIDEPPVHISTAPLSVAIPAPSDCGLPAPLQRSADVETTKPDNILASAGPKVIRDEPIYSSTPEDKVHPKLSPPDSSPINVSPVKHVFSAEEARRHFAARALRLSVWVKAENRRVKNMVHASRQFVGAVGPQVIAMGASARAKILDARLWEKLRTNSGRAGSALYAQSRSASATVRGTSKRMQSKAKVWLVASLPQSRTGKPSIQSPAAPLAPTPLRSPRRDLRLWTSFAMAGLSALLTLGFISAARHYATGSLPSHLLVHSSPPVCTPSEPANLVHPRPATAVASVPKTPASRPASPTRLAAAVKPMRPKPRHTEEDDYVARDTFVSYANRRSGSQ